MKSIKQITISNYRAFYNESGETNKYQINLKNGENLLVYGENGSGKSSLFKAMEDFFLSSKQVVDLESNIYTEGSPDLPESLIRIKFSDNSEFEFNRTNSTAFNDPLFINTTKAFLSYKDILATYYQDINKKHNPNLFDLFLNNLINYVTDASTNRHIKDEIAEIKRLAKTFSKAYKQSIRRISDTDTRVEIFNNLKSSLDNKIGLLNKSLTILLNPVLKKVNAYLKNNFKSNLKVTIQNKDKYIKLKGKGLDYFILENLSFKLTYNSKMINKHVYQSFINEARLSALALTIYFAALKIESERILNQDIKFLFLDDIFIGLDTSNRIPLLDILNNDFKDFQIIITTYDRYWYEIVSAYFNKSWKNIELYTGGVFENITIAGIDKAILKFESPVLINEDLDPYTKAKRYFEAFDYYSAGNALRKLLEERLKFLVPNTYLITEKDLEGNINKLKQFYKDCECEDLLSGQLITDLYLFKDIILNPASHFDLSSPLYRVEIQKAFKTIDLLYSIPKLDRKLLLPIGEILAYENISANYEAKYVLIENCYKITIKDMQSRITDPSHKITHWKKNGTHNCNAEGTEISSEEIKRITNQKMELSQRPLKIKHFLNLIQTPDWKLEFRTVHGKSINDLM